MRTSDADLLIVPGLGGSGPDHWQTRWEQKLSTARRVEQSDWE
jgi:predicted alpha/beta hydrolase family esterase